MYNGSFLDSDRPSLYRTDSGIIIVVVVIQYTVDISATVNIIIIMIIIAVVDIIAIATAGTGCTTRPAMASNGTIITITPVGKGSSPYRSNNRR